MDNSRLKFRVWNKKRHIMSYDAEESISFSEYIYADCRDVMQCTGLHDKNGMLIYEGDVVKITGHDGYKDIDLITVCEWEESHARFMFAWGDGWRYHMDHIRAHEFKLEVLGNVYEHSRLIEGGK